LIVTPAPDHRHNSNSIGRIRLIVESLRPVTLVGAGPVGARPLRAALARAPVAVAADGGADRLLARGIEPEAVIGDLDSLSDAARRAIPAGRLHRIAEQETTDFDKALRSVRAPLILALGFQDGRLDHSLDALATLVRRPAPCILIGPVDLAFAVAGEVVLDLSPGTRLSLFPMRPVTGRSDGLTWPIDGIAFAPDGRSGTSNRVAARPVRLWLDGPGMIAILPRRNLDAAIRAVARGQA
jgi:thiamine pyrophosphokinase